MTINITTPALLFPAISLLLLAYTNRFLGVASIIRQLGNQLYSVEHEGRFQQIENLNKRLTLIKVMQLFGIASILFCVMAMMFLFWDAQPWGQKAFAMSLILMTFSLVFSFWEIMLSGNALRIELEDIRACHERWLARKR